jgi:hypothetical protein
VTVTVELFRAKAAELRHENCVGQKKRTSVCALCLKIVGLGWGSSRTMLSKEEA